MRLIFFFKMFELHLHFRKGVKNWGKIFSFLCNFISIGCRRFPQFPGQYFSSGVNVLTNALEISDITQKVLLQLKFSQIHKKNLIKLLLCILRQCFGGCHILSVLGCTETWLFRHIRKQLFRSPKFCKEISYETHLFSKCFKLIADYRIAVKYWTTTLYFLR